VITRSMSEIPPGSILLKVTEAASTLGLGRSTVWGLVWSGDLPVVRVGRAVRIPRAGLEAWVKSRTEGGT
jgi:excisionase family DNA binding protein